MLKSSEESVTLYFVLYFTVVRHGRACRRRMYLHRSSPHMTLLICWRVVPAPYWTVESLCEIRVVRKRSQDSELGWTVRINSNASDLQTIVRLMCSIEDDTDGFLRFNASNPSPSVSNEEHCRNNGYYQLPARTEQKRTYIVLAYSPDPNEMHYRQSSQDNAKQNLPVTSSCRTCHHCHRSRSDDAL